MNKTNICLQKKEGSKGNAVPFDAFEEAMKEDDQNQLNDTPPPLEKDDLMLLQTSGKRKNRYDDDDEDELLFQARTAKSKKKRKIDTSGEKKEKKEKKEKSKTKSSKTTERKDSTKTKPKTTRKNTFGKQTKAQIKRNARFESTGVLEEYSSEKIFNNLPKQNAKATGKDLVYCNEIDKTRFKLEELIRKRKNVYPINNSKESLQMFHDVCDAKGKNAEIARTTPVPNGFAVVFSTEEHLLIPFFIGLCFVFDFSINPADIYYIINAILIYVLERKASDLSSSIISGLLKDQTERMKGIPIHPSQIGFIRQLPKKTSKYDATLGKVRTCESNRIFRDHMFWRKSDGLLDTVLIIYKDMLSILEKGCAYYDAVVAAQSAPTFSSPLSSVPQFQSFQLPMLLTASATTTNTNVIQDSASQRRAGGSHHKGGRPIDQLTPDVVWRLQLECYPGIGTVIAAAVVKKYSSMIDLVHAYDACTTEQEKEELLIGLPCEAKLVEKRLTVKEQDAIKAGKIKKLRTISADISKLLYYFIKGKSTSKRPKGNHKDSI